MTIRSPLAYCGIHAAAGVADDERVAAQGLHDADGQGDLFERIALVEVEPALHRHDLLAAEACRRRAGRRVTWTVDAGKCGISS